MAPLLLGVMIAGCGNTTQRGLSQPLDCAEMSAGPGLQTADVVVYGATPSGIAAAIAAARHGKTVILLEPSLHVGGKYGNGIGITEVLDRTTVGGIAGEFLSGMDTFYGPSWRAGWEKFEPHAANVVITHMLCEQAGIRPIIGAALASVAKTGATIESITTADQATYAARMFVDASYEGDLLAAAGVHYTTGREAMTQYGESLAGVRPAGGPLNMVIDPYVTPGDATSGVLPHVSTDPPGAFGEGDDRVEAYTYRVCVTKNADNRVPFTAPPNYDPAEFEVVARWIESEIAAGQTPQLDRIVTMQGLPDRKFDLNNVGSLSVDYVGESQGYIEASSDQRQAIAAEHERYVRAYLYFLQTEPRLRPAINDAVAELGFCKDEYVDNHNFPSQLYVREARRMIGPTVMTQDTVASGAAQDSIGIGAYNIDVHSVSLFALTEYRHTAQAIVAEEGHLSTKVQPYQIPYGALTPAPADATNLLVSDCVSASHVAFASVRVEPTVMIMGHAAGDAAALAIDSATTVQQVDYHGLSQALLHEGQILDWPIPTTASDAL